MERLYWFVKLGGDDGEKAFEAAALSESFHRRPRSA